MMNQETISQEERQLALLVRTTLHTATTPSPGQLATLMPPVPPQKAPLASWSRQWVALAASLLLLLGSLGTFFVHQQSWLAPITPTYLAVTATQTNVPTSTLANTNTGQQALPRQTVAALPLVQPVIVVTPAPNPTPILDN